MGLAEDAAANGWCDIAEYLRIGYDAGLSHGGLWQCDHIELEDSPATAFYCDPPYLPETRKSSGDYRCEMTAEQHAALLDQLNSVHGAVLLSGYPHASYERSLRGWKRIARSVFAYSSSWQHRGQTELAKRTECLWIKPASRPSRPTGLRPCPQKPTGAPTERVVPRPSKRPCRPVPTAVRRSSRLSLARNLHGRSKPPRHRE